MEREKDELQKEVNHLREIEIVRLREANEEKNRQNKEQEKQIQSILLNNDWWYMFMLGLELDKAELKKEITDLKEVEIIRLSKEIEEKLALLSSQEKRAQELESERIGLQKEIAGLKESHTETQVQSSEEKNRLQAEYERVVQGNFNKICRRLTML